MIKGNDVILTCKIPSFVADFVQVIGWVDNEGSSFTAAQAAGI